MDEDRGEDWREAVKEHPDDRRTRLEGEAYAIERAGRFCFLNADRLRQLIATHSDADAGDLLDQLRESFWTRSWEESE